MIGLALAVGVHRLVGGLDLGVRRLIVAAAVSAVAMVLGLLAAEQAGSPLSALILSGTVVVLVSWLGGGLARVFPEADVEWLADAVGDRLGSRGPGTIRRALAPFS